VPGVLVHDAFEPLARPARTVDAAGALFEGTPRSAASRSNTPSFQNAWSISPELIGEAQIPHDESTRSSLKCQTLWRVPADGAAFGPTALHNFVRHNFGRRPWLRGSGYEALPRNPLPARLRLASGRQSRKDSAFPGRAWERCAARYAQQQRLGPLRTASVRRGGDFGLRPRLPSLVCRR